MHIKLPNSVEYILNILNKNGHEAFVVGGCVRDSLLNKKPNDWDITTSAEPEEVKKCFKEPIFDTGLKHGTVSLLINKEIFEITTYRMDGEYKDGRHPENVNFTKSLAKDLERRDFTINAMAYNHIDGLIDLFNGKNDLDNKIIKAVGDPIKRFNEDGLRMMRAIRFAAQLGYKLDKKTYNAIKECSNLITKISAERIENELSKILTSNFPEKIIDLYDLGITNYIMPEFNSIMECEQNNKWHYANVGNHTIDALKNIKNDKILRWAALLHDIGKPESKSTDERGFDHFHGHPKVSVDISKNILKRLKFSNKEKERILSLVELHDSYKVSKSTVKKWIAKYGDSFVDDLIELQKADSKAHVEAAYEIKFKLIDQLLKYKNEIIEENSAVSLKDLEINGHDLINIGYNPGKNIGIILNKILEEVISERLSNNKEELIKYVNENFKK